MEQAPLLFIRQGTRQKVSFLQRQNAAELLLFPLDSAVDVPV